DGALSACESLAIMQCAAQAPDGDYLEMGVYKGKSLISALQALKAGKFYLIEPEFNDNEWVKDVIKLASSVTVNIFGFVPIVDYSINVLKDCDKMFSYVFSDAGNHQDGLPMQEVKLLEDRIIKDGIIAFHDFKSQFIEVEEAYNYLLSTGKYEEV